MSAAAPAGALIQTFNTHLMDDATITALRTARETELRFVMDAIARGRRMPGLPQHVAIYGPRGFGKSFLARMVEIEVERIPRDAGPPVEFVLLPEEQVNLARNPHGLLEYITNKLAERRTGERRSWELSAFKWPRPAQAEALWHNAASGLEHELDLRFGATSGLAVVVVENFDMLLGTVFKEDLAEQRLRNWLNRPHNRVMLLATATGALDLDYDRPLFQAFQPIHLTAWTPDDCIVYFNKRRELEGRPSLDARTEAKARAIADFIGGNPRLAQLLSEVLDTENALTVAQTLNALADKLADYYRRRIDDLAQLAQGLLDALIRGGEPSSATELADRTEADQSDIARVMQDLQRADIIRATPAPDSREKLFRVTDRVFVHFYRLRQGDATARTSPLLTILDFLRAFYSREEQKAQAARYLDLGRPAEARVFSRLAMEGTREAGYSGYRGTFNRRLARHLAAAPERSDLDVDAIMTALENEPEEVPGRCAARPCPTTLEVTIGLVIRAQAETRMELLDQAETALRRALECAAGDPAATVVAVDELGKFLWHERRDQSAATAILAMGVGCAGQDLPPTLRLTAQLDQAFLLSLDPRKVDDALVAADAAMAAAIQLGDRPGEVLAARYRMYAFNSAGHHDAAVEAAEVAARLAAEAGNPRSRAESLRFMAYALNALGRKEDTLTRAREASSIAATAAAPDEEMLARLEEANALLNLNRNEDAIIAVERTVILAEQLDVPDTMADALYVKALALGKLRRFEEALATNTMCIPLARRAGDVTTVLKAEVDRIWLLERLERDEDAVAEADRVAEEAAALGQGGVQAEAVRLKAWSLHTLGRQQEALDAADRALALVQNESPVSWCDETERIAINSLAALDRTDEAWARLTAWSLRAENLDTLRSCAIQGFVVAQIAARPEMITVYERWFERSMASGTEDIARVLVWFDDFLASVMRAHAWPELESFLLRHGGDIARRWDFSLFGAIGLAFAAIASEQGRAAGFGAAREILARLATLARHPAAARNDQWVAGLVAALAQSCRDPGLLRDVAGLITDDLAEDAVQQRALLLALADFDEGPGGPAGLARLDPDVATWIRRIRDVPEETSRPKRAKSRAPRKKQ